MTMKITKTGRGSERNDETLLFEWLNHEVPESIKLSYETMLNTNKFAGSLQTNQIMGVYLEPITFNGEFFGEYISINNSNKFEYITAKERSDQLSRLQGRIVKFWFEGIKQLVIIQKYEIDIKNYNHIEYTLTLQPHDIQLPINPIDVKQYLSKSFIQANEPTTDPEKISANYDLIEDNYHSDFKNKNNDNIINKQYEIQSNKQIFERNIEEFKKNESLINTQKDIYIGNKTKKNEDELRRLVDKRKSIKKDIENLKTKIDRDIDYIKKQQKVMNESAKEVAKKLQDKNLKFGFK